MKLEFFVVGNPKAQPRTKHTKGHTFNPDSADHWKLRVKEHLLAHWDGIPFVGPVRVSLVFHFRRPTSHYAKAGGLRPSAPKRWHMIKPDRDNLDKAVLDALTGLNLWRDDCAVCAGEVKKVWAESPGCHITVELLED